MGCKTVKRNGVRDDNVTDRLCPLKPGRILGSADVVLKLASVIRPHHLRTSGFSR